MNKKQRKWRNRILVALGLFAIIFAAEHLLPLADMLGSEAAAVYLLFALYLVPYLIAGHDVLLRAVSNIRSGQVFDENLLMAIATIGAFAMIAFPDAEPSMAEGCAVMLFYQVGELFQSYAVGKSRKSIAAMMDIAPDYANVEQNGELAQVDPAEVAAGDTIVVKPGERVPIDGTIIEGASQLDTAALTGESVPRHVEAGMEVISGCVNMTGLLRVRTTKPFGEYTVSLTFLVVSCPCALVISVPLSFFGGIGGASKLGVLVKGSNYLEALAKVDTVVFDKTGTLTNGTFNVVAVHTEQDVDPDHLLSYAAHAESYSDHPIALSVKEAYSGKIDQERIRDVREEAGHGVAAVIDEHVVLVGNDKLMNANGTSYHDCELTGTILHVSIDGSYAGHIVIADVVKDDAAEAIKRLHDAGVRKTVMLTGDRAEVAQAVSEQLGIDEFHAQLLPADKVAQVERLLSEQKDGENLAFVGDGINDAPVLTRADVGIAMGAMGSDAAIEAADVVLMDDKPSNISRAIRLARRTMRIVWQNIVFALGVKLIVLVLAAVGIANMWLAVFADVGVAILAILNAMRCMNVNGLRK